MTVEVTRLANGLTVATDRMDSVETVSLGAWVRVGTRHERAELNGVAHFLEHMVFKGTERRSAQDIAQEIEAVGGHLNAYTGRESTAFHAKVLAEHLPLALDLVSDIVQYPVFDETELTRERAVVLQEIGQVADTPDDVIFDHFQETAFPSQALGRPLLGRSETVAVLERTNLIDYRTRHYGPGDMVIAAAGRLEHDRFCDLAAAAFGALPTGGQVVAEPARYSGGDFREARELEQVHLVLGFEGVGHHDPDYYAAMVFSTLFGGGMSSRLFQEVRELRGLAYAIHSFVWAYDDSGLFGVYAGTGQAEVAELLSVVCGELGKLPSGLNSDEMARARAQLKAGVLMSREGTTSRCEQLANQLLLYGRALAVAEVIERIESVDYAALERFTGRLTGSTPTLTVIGPIDCVDSFDQLSARLAVRPG